MPDKTLIGNDALNLLTRTDDLKPPVYIPRLSIVVQIAALILTFFYLPLASADIRWEAQQLEARIGSVADAKNHLFKADVHGRILIEANASNLSLDLNPIVIIEFSSLPAEFRAALAWKTDGPNSRTYQYQLPRFDQDTVQLTLVNHPDWAGNAKALMLGIAVLPYQEVGVRSISVRAQTLLQKMAYRFQEWSSFQPWTASSVNLYSGTPGSVNSGTPVVFLSYALALLLMLYLLLSLVTGRLPRFGWKIAGIIILACWITLDMFWQARLVRQVMETYAEYSGKTASEKLLASTDKYMVEFIARVKDKIPLKDARVFLGSGSDYLGMLGAYYIAPVNTYWHRFGPELPEKDYLFSGDYILLIAPFSARYDPIAHTISAGKDESIEVKEILKDHMGLLVRVI